jgi:hypothetical protein
VTLSAGVAVADGTCSFCDGSLSARYVHYGELGYDVCDRCMAAEACSLCGLPMAGRNRGDGSHCARCEDRADRCSACGRPIFERYWEVAGVPGRFCTRCRDEAPACSACGAPTRAGLMRDGRALCRTCNAGRVIGREGYETVYRRLLERARDRLGLVLESEPPLVVESVNGIESRPGLPELHEGLCGLYVRDARGNTSIHVLSDLPESRLAAVLGHELAHAWQGERCPDEQSTRVREGFAEWVAWHLLDGEEQADRERQVIAARTDEYGRGFRLFADLESQHGSQFALWWATAARATDERSAGE